MFLIGLEIIPIFLGLAIGITSERKLRIIALDGSVRSMLREGRLIVLLRITVLLVAAEALLIVLRRGVLGLLVALLRSRLLIATIVLGLLVILLGLIYMALESVLVLGVALLRLLAIAEVHIACQNLCRSALITFLVSPVADLQPALDHNHAALVEILIHELSGTIPGHAVDEVGFSLLTIRGIVTINGHGKTGHRLTGISSAKLNIASESSHDTNKIQHALFLLDLLIFSLVSLLLFAPVW